MDAVVILVAAVIFRFLVFRPEPVQAGCDDTGLPIEEIVINPRLNPTMEHDEHAFMKIAHELGF